MRICYVNWGSGPLRCYDNTPTETAPLGGGDIAPVPTYDNPNK